MTIVAGNTHCNVISISVQHWCLHFPRNWRASYQLNILRARKFFWPTVSSVRKETRTNWTGNWLWVPKDRVKVVFFWINTLSFIILEVLNLLELSRSQTWALRNHPVIFELYIAVRAFQACWYFVPIWDWLRNFESPRFLAVFCEGDKLRSKSSWAVILKDFTSQGATCRVVITKHSVKVVWSFIVSSVFNMV